MSPIYENYQISRELYKNGDAPSEMISPDCVHHTASYLVAQLTVYVVSASYNVTRLLSIAK